MRPRPISTPDVPAAYEEAARTADLIIFVIDSQEARREANIHCIGHQRDWLARAGRSLDETPCVLQYNKRDLPTAESVAALDRALNRRGWPRFETVAPSGVGVLETLNEGLLRISGTGLA